MLSLCLNDKTSPPFLSGCASLVCAPKPVYVHPTGPCTQNYINFSLKRTVTMAGVMLLPQLGEL